MIIFSEVTQWIHQRKEVTDETVSKALSSISLKRQFSFQTICFLLHEDWYLESISFVWNREQSHLRSKWPRHKHSEPLERWVWIVQNNLICCTSRFTSAIMTTVGITDDTHFNYLLCMNNYVVKCAVCSELHPQNQRLRLGLYERARPYKVPDNCIPHKREERVYFMTVFKKMGSFKLIICVGWFEHLLGLIHQHLVPTADTGLGVTNWQMMLFIFLFFKLHLFFFLLNF